MATHSVLIDHTAPSVSHISVAVATITGLHSAKLRVLRITLHLAHDKIMCFVTLLHYNIQLSLASALASTYHSYKQTLGPFQHLQCMLCSPTQIAACHRHLYLAQARPHDAVSICLVTLIMIICKCIIGASLSEPHTYVKYATAVRMCIYIYIYIFIYLYICAVRHAV